MDINYVLILKKLIYAVQCPLQEEVWSVQFFFCGLEKDGGQFSVV